PVDADRPKASAAWRRGHHFALTTHVDGDDLLSCPVGQPKSVVVPPRRLAEDDSFHQRVKLRHRRFPSRTAARAVATHLVRRGWSAVFDTCRGFVHGTFASRFEMIRLCRMPFQRPRGRTRQRFWSSSTRRSQSWIAGVNATTPPPRRVFPRT